MLVCDKLPAGADPPDPCWPRWRRSRGRVAQVPAAPRPARRRQGIAVGRSVVRTGRPGGQASGGAGPVQLARRDGGRQAVGTGQPLRRPGLGDGVAGLRRVVTLESNRPEAETLGMLRQAMKQAENAEDKQLVLVRASTVCTIKTVVGSPGTWTIRSWPRRPANPSWSGASPFLRHPNIDRFGPLWRKRARSAATPPLRNEPRSTGSAVATEARMQTVLPSGPPTVSGLPWSTRPVQPAAARLRDRPVPGGRRRNNRRRCRAVF